MKSSARIKGLLLILGGLLIGGSLGAMIIGFGGNAPGEKSPGGDTRRVPAKGLPLADFELATSDGEIVSLSQFRGKTVILNFWATWCEPCKEEMPLLVQVAEAYGDEVVVLGINARESAREVTSFAEEYDISFPLLLDENGEVQSLYYVRGFPTTFFLDKDGVLQSQHIGLLNEELVRDYLKRLGVTF
jgi:thiol-disulfide isomerase/thioredoxin